MRLTRIRIKGFKSFADETELQFDKGVGVIVGPNGSGKSNIAESLRWAMASQAPSEVRVATGLDVLDLLHVTRCMARAAGRAVLS